MDALNPWGVGWNDPYMGSYNWNTQQSRALDQNGKESLGGTGYNGAGASAPMPMASPAMPPVAAQAPAPAPVTAAPTSPLQSNASSVGVGNAQQPLGSQQGAQPLPAWFSNSDPPSFAPWLEAMLQGITGPNQGINANGMQGGASPMNQSVNQPNSWGGPTGMSGVSPGLPNSLLSSNFSLGHSALDELNPSPNFGGWSPNMQGGMPPMPSTAPFQQNYQSQYTPQGALSNMVNYTGP